MLTIFSPISVRGDFPIRGLPYVTVGQTVTVGHVDCQRKEKTEITALLKNRASVCNEAISQCDSATFRTQLLGAPAREELQTREAS